MNLDTLILFYKICKELNVDRRNIETKERILAELANYKKMTI